MNDFLRSFLKLPYGVTGGEGINRGKSHTCWAARASTFFTSVRVQSTE